MKKILLILFGLLPMYFVSAQEVRTDSILGISGFVAFSVDSTRISDVHVLNLCKGTGTVTSLDGSFSLMVRNSDTLRFSCIGFRDHFLFVTGEMLRPEILILLVSDTIQMDELRVSPLPPRRFFPIVFLTIGFLNLLALEESL